MNKLILALLAPVALALAACNPSGPGPSSPSDLPVVSAVCPAIQSDKFDLALKAYGAATDAVNLLIDHKVIVPGTPRALAIANANDKVLSAFAVAESARRACNSTGYLAAIAEVQAGIAEVRAALKS